MKNIKFIALGGQDERGKNMYALEIGSEIFILDAGVKFPEKGILGVDVVIPNYEYLKENQKKIKGLFLTNISAYNSGAANYLIKDLNVSVFCNKITAHALKIKARRSFTKNYDNNFKILYDKQIIKFENTQVEIFRTTASSPQTFGYAFKTDLGLIVYVGDYIIDGQEQTLFSTDFNHLSNISKKGVLALISDASFASRSGFTVPNHKIDRYINTSFKEKKKKIAIGIFEEDIFKLGEIIKVAKENNRKIAVYGRTVGSLLENKSLLDSFTPNKTDLISVEKYMKSDNGVLIITGNSDVLYSKLNKIANNDDEIVEFGKNDLIILATPPAPGIEKKHAAILDELARTDAKVIALSDRNIWSMNASFEDIKVMTSIMKPKYFIPVKALYKDFIKAESAALLSGVKPSNIGIIDNGQTLMLSGKQLAISEHVIKEGDVYIDGLGMGDIGNVVLNERKQLASDGAMVVGLSLDYRNKSLISSIDIQMRGVFYIKEENTIFKQLQKQITDIISQGQTLFQEDPKKYDLGEIKKEIVNKVRLSVKQESGKQPMVLVIINEIGEKEYVPHVRQTWAIKSAAKNKLSKKE